MCVCLSPTVAFPAPLCAYPGERPFWVVISQPTCKVQIASLVLRIFCLRSPPSHEHSWFHNYSLRGQNNLRNAVKSGMKQRYLDKVFQGMNRFVHSNQVMNLRHVVYDVLYHPADRQRESPPDEEKQKRGSELNSLTSTLGGQARCLVL